MFVKNQRKMLKGIPQRLHQCHQCTASYFHRGSLLFHLDVHHEAQKQAELRKLFSKLSAQSKVKSSSITKITLINTNNAITNTAAYQPCNKDHTFNISLDNHLKPFNKEVQTTNENKVQKLVPSFAFMIPNKRLSPFKTHLKSIEPFVDQETEYGISSIEDNAVKQNASPNNDHPASQFPSKKINAMKNSFTIPNPKDQTCLALAEEQMVCPISQVSFDKMNGKRYLTKESETCTSSEEKMDVCENKDETPKTTVCQPCNRDYIFEGSLAKHLIQCPNKSPEQTSPKNKTEIHPRIGHTYMKLIENNKPKTNSSTENVRFINPTQFEETMIKRDSPNESSSTKLRTVDTLQIKVAMSESIFRENFNVNQNANRKNHVLRKDDLLKENYFAKMDMHEMGDPKTTKTLKYLIPIFVKEIPEVSNETPKPEEVNKHNRIKNNSAFCKLCNRDYIYKSNLVNHLSKCKHTNRPKQNKKIRISTSRGNPKLSSPALKAASEDTCSNLTKKIKMQF